jgi:hypothetical protein
MNISAHVTRAEFEHSNTAINFGLDNSMNSTQLQCAIDICENIFEPLRKFVDGPIRINSGFRGVAVNKHTKGSSKTSQHCLGQALDLHIGAKEFHFIKDNLPFDQLIWEGGNTTQPQWVHVSFKKEGGRKQVLRMTVKGGKSTYTPF